MRRDTSIYQTNFSFKGQRLNLSRTVGGRNVGMIQAPERMKQVCLFR